MSSAVEAAFTRRRARALVVLLAVLAAAYCAALTRFDLAYVPHEHRFPSGQAVIPVGLYLDPIGIDVIDESMQVRLYVNPDAALLGREPGSVSRPVTLTLDGSGVLERHAFRPDEPIQPIVVTLDLDGPGVGAYPFDSYRARLRFQLSDGGAAPAGPREIAVWEQLPGYRLEASQAGDGAALALSIRRSDAQAFFALAAYGSMVVVALCALTISGLVFVGRRKVEAALTCALGPLVFALPALRAALPGAPPLGVRADLMTFLWAEMATVLALALFVFRWARQRG